MGADLGDVNNDGLIDFFSADMAVTSHEMDQHDLATARSKIEDPKVPGTAPKYNHNALQMNTGTPFTAEAAFLAGISATNWSGPPFLKTSTTTAGSTFS